MSYKSDRRAKTLKANRPKVRQDIQWKSILSGPRHPSRKTGMSYHFHDWVNHYNTELVKLKELRKLEREGK